MKTLYDAHAKKKRVEISAVELISNSENATLPGKVTAAKIVRMYFKIARRTVLAGYDFKFHNGMKLGVRKERIDGVFGLSRFRRDENNERIKVRNMRRINERYSIVFSGGPISSEHYIFIRNSIFKKLLTARLFNTDTVYPTKESA